MPSTPQNRNIISSWVDSSGHTHYNNYGIKEDPSKYTSPNLVTTHHLQTKTIKNDYLQIPIFKNKKQAIVTDYREKPATHLQPTKSIKTEPIKPTTLHKNLIGNGAFWFLLVIVICIKMLLESTKYNKRKRVVPSFKYYLNQEKTPKRILQKNKAVKKDTKKVPHKVNQQQSFTRENLLLRKEPENQITIIPRQTPDPIQQKTKNQILLKSKDIEKDTKKSPREVQQQSFTKENLLSSGEPESQITVIPKQEEVDHQKKWTIDFLRSIEWKLFEDLCETLFRYEGYKAETTGNGPDGGIDIKIYDKKEKTKIYAIAQCKAQKKNIGVAKTRELLGIMTDHKIEEGFYATTADYTKDAIKFVQGKKITLKNGKDILKKIRALRIEQQKELYDEITEGDYTTPSCASCGTKMVLSLSKKKWRCKRCRNSIWAKKT